MRYDLDRLKADINMKQIIPYIVSYDEIKYSGSTMYCKCVSGLHSESNLSHNAVNEKYCHCFSCGETYDAFDYIKRYYEQQNISISFGEICQKIGDALGGAEMYTTTASEVKKELPLTKEEFEIIGLSTSSKKGAPSISKMYEEDPESVNELLKKRAYEMMNKYKILSEDLSSSELSKEYLRLYKEARDIYEKLGGENKAFVRLFKV